MKLIKIKEDHYIIVDDSEIKDGDWMHLQQGNTPSTKQGEIARCEFADANNLGVIWKKITHSTQPFEYVQSLDLSEVRELIGEVDVEEMANKLTKHLTFPDERKKGIIDGYYQALEDNKDRRFSEEDILNILYDYNNVDWSKREHKQSFIMMREWFSEKLQSLQPKTEWEVEFIDGKLKLL